MGLNMLAAYYDSSVDSDALFCNLDIGKDPSYREHLNQYDVIRINMQEFLSGTSTVSEMLNLLREYLLLDIEENYQQIWLRDKNNLVQIMKDVYAKTNRPFIILIDEWDCLFRESQDDKEAQKKYLDFLRAWLKDQEYVALAYMTGILPNYLYDSTIDIGDPTDIYFVLEGWNYTDEDETEGERLVTGLAHIYPDGEENAVSYEQEAQDTDIVLCEEEGVTILYVGGEDDYDGEDWDGYTLTYYAVNSSDSDVSFEVTPVAVNGTEVDVTGWEAGNLALLAGKVRYSSYIMYNDYLLADLELTDSSEIETVDVQVVIYDLETEEELYTTTVTIAVN